MRPILLLNDLHLGVQRTGGTTLASAAALRASLLANLGDLLMGHMDKDIVINGDIFDTFSAPMWDVLAFYEIASTWLSMAVGLPNDELPRLILGRGNHDVSKDSAKLSSFDFVGKILRAQWGLRVLVVDKPTRIAHGIDMIPHMPNQDLFNHELEHGMASQRENSLILLHANWDNNFAIEADHSLNVSQEQAEKLIARGNCLLFGHEHQKRHALNDQVLVTGNQWPTSIADCLGNPNGVKHAHVLQSNGVDIEVQALETWNAAQSYDEIPWNHVDSWAYANSVSFIRFVGTATAEQAPEVIAAIAKFRASSNAYVVSNAVKIEGVNDMVELSLSAEEVKAFDVLTYLLEQLEPAQAECVKGLLAKAEPLKEAA